MKVDKYYDVGCNICGRHLSTDFKCGMAETPAQARVWAKQVGFTSKNICPICVVEMQEEDLQEETNSRLSTD